MKSKTILTLVAAVAGLATAAVLAKSNGKPLIVHEWGTFTSLQGGDGKLVPWSPLKTAELPKFVYDRNKAARELNRSNMFLISKGSVVALQRLETPVVYFYSDQNQTMNLSVKFPQGFITEWYPRASEVAPLTAMPMDTSGAGDDPKKSLIRWSNLHIFPGVADAKNASLLPTDASGSHYFAARETDSDYINTEVTKDVPQAQYEKFLFYRGVGNFGTPLRATMDADGRVSVLCGAWTTLEHLFVLEVKNKAGSFTEIKQLGPGETKVISTGKEKQTLSAEALVKQLSAAMTRALVSQGLYPKEAQAMVNTWKDSWFAEDGIRVLYLLPRAWTDAALPMTLDPQPTELVRVMVGRAEILTPAVEHSLVLELDRAKHGDVAARNQLRVTLKSLGRFAEPALDRAFAHSAFDREHNFQYAAMLYDAPGAN